MLFQEKLSRLRDDLAQSNLDGWLLYDFRRSNDLACQFLEIPNDRLLTRRFFYWIPKDGDPVKLVHSIESHSLEHLPGLQVMYHTWEELEAKLAAILKPSKRIAMEYSPRNAIPYVSKVDGGTLELIRAFDIEVVSSADLLQQFTSIWTSQQLKSHLIAAEVLVNTVSKAWDWIRDHLMHQRTVSEFDVQEYILSQFQVNNCVTADSPICAVNAHSADPHYVAKKESASIINPGDFILIDLWCKQNHPSAVYADITQVGVAGMEPTQKQEAIFDIVKRARNEATRLVKSRFELNLPLMGWEVDQCCRHVIKEAGYGDYFIHRTGHNIGENDHGCGANLDSFETLDRRKLLRGSCFSIEPGIYLPGEFGVRLEYDIYVHLDGNVQITGGIQEKIVTLKPNMMT